MKTGPSLADFIAGQYAATGVLAALYERDGPNGTGEGRHIDMALPDCTIAAQTHSVMTYLAAGVVPPRRGTEGNGGFPSQVFECADGGVIVICGSEPPYRSFCEVLRHPELSDDPRFVTNSQRLAHRRELAETLNALTRRWNAKDLMVALEAAGIPSGPINHYPEVFADPQVVHRGVAQRVPHPTAGEVTLCANPILFTGPAAAAQGAAGGAAHGRDPAGGAGPGRGDRGRAGRTPRAATRGGARHGRLRNHSCEVGGVGEGIATITLNRPKSLNAINRRMADETTDALHRPAAWMRRHRRFNM